jgi:hypothetical protein
MTLDEFTKKKREPDFGATRQTGKTDLVAYLTKCAIMGIEPTLNMSLLHVPGADYSADAVRDGRFRGRYE